MLKTLSPKVRYAANMVFDVPETYEESFMLYRLLCNGAVHKDFLDTQAEAHAKYLERLEQLFTGVNLQRLGYGLSVHVTWLLLVVRDPYTGEVEYTFDTGSITCMEHH